MGLSKPPYHVPLMEEIRQLPSNGFKVISTFAGGGGSTTGYKMAGFDVIWANEFLPAAQATYAANHPDTILDGRSIHDLTAGDILSATGLKAGELDLFDGSPPCQSFSMAGKREKKWGVEVDYGDGLKQRNDDLFFEYTRLLRGLQPKVFVAENVSGLVKGVAKGYFKIILRALRGCGYTVEAKLLDAQWLGVPQARQRIIFIGVRSDLDALPAFPVPLPYRYSVRDAIGAGVMDDTSGFVRNKDVSERPCPTITIGANSMNSHHYQVLESMAGHTRGPGLQDMSLERPAPTIISSGAAQQRIELVERIEGANGFNGHAYQSTATPAATVQAGRTLSIESKSTERRKLTIAELKRICSFPDDYILTGSYADQWERCGNSVPPVMMASIAAVIRDQILALIQ